MQEQEEQGEQEEPLPWAPEGAPEGQGGQGEQEEPLPWAPEGAPAVQTARFSQSTTEKTPRAATVDKMIGNLHLHKTRNAMFAHNGTRQNGALVVCK